MPVHPTSLGQRSEMISWGATWTVQLCAETCRVHINTIEILIFAFLFFKTNYDIDGISIKLLKVEYVETNKSKISKYLKIITF